MILGESFTRRIAFVNEMAKMKMMETCRNRENNRQAPEAAVGNFLVATGGPVRSAQGASSCMLTPANPPSSTHAAIERDISRRRLNELRQLYGDHDMTDFPHENAGMPENRGGQIRFISSLLNEFQKRFVHVEENAWRHFLRRKAARCYHEIGVHIPVLFPDGAGGCPARFSKRQRLDIRCGKRMRGSHGSCRRFRRAAGENNKFTFYGAIAFSPGYGGGWLACCGRPERFLCYRLIQGISRYTFAQGDV